MNAHLDCSIAGIGNIGDNKYLRIPISTYILVDFVLIRIVDCVN